MRDINAAPPLNPSTNPSSQCTPPKNDAPKEGTTQERRHHSINWSRVSPGGSERSWELHLDDAFMIHEGNGTKGVTITGFGHQPKTRFSPGSVPRTFNRQHMHMQNHLQSPGASCPDPTIVHSRTTTTVYPNTPATAKGCHHWSMERELPPHRTMQEKPLV